LIIGEEKVLPGHESDDLERLHVEEAEHMREESVGQILQSEVVPVGVHGEVLSALGQRSCGDA